MIRRLSPQVGQKIREASREISGVNETVASGLSLPLSRPWLLAVPILLDVMLWIGIQVPITRITNPLSDWMAREGGEDGELVADQLNAIGETFRLNDVIGSMLPSVFSGLSRENLFNIMISVYVPGLSGGIDRNDLASIWSSLIGNTVDPGGILPIIGLGLLFFVVSTLLTVGWRVPIAMSVVQITMTPGKTVAYILRAWIRFVGFIALLGIVAMIAIVPLILVTGIMLLAGLDVRAILSLLIVMAASLIAIYARFVLESIILNDIGPLRALKRSAMVAQMFFGATVRFAIAVVLIAAGALRLWDIMVSAPPGLPVAIIVNSFLGTGLAVASMMFYYDRDRLIEKFSPVSASAKTETSQTPL